MSEYTIDPGRYAAITLAQGAHDADSGELCVMEAVAFLVGEQHSDHPRCVSPVLGEFGRALNDCLPDDLRQELKGLIPSLPGTANDGFDERRSYMALDWLIRTWLPAWLELSPVCREVAARVRGLGRIVDVASAEQAASVWAGSVFRRAEKLTFAVTAAPAAEYAAAEAARSAAGSAAAAAMAAGARSAEIARSAWEIAVPAAAAGYPQGAAGGFFAPTVRELQLSAIDLFAEMIKNPS